MAKEKPTVTERYWNETMSNNAAMNHFAQCADCLCRDKTTYKDADGKPVECGWYKGTCEIFPYPESKPDEVYNNSGPCEYYAKESGKFEK